FYEASEAGLLDEIAGVNPPKRVVGGISVPFSPIRLFGSSPGALGSARSDRSRKLLVARGLCESVTGTTFSDQNLTSTVARSLWKNTVVLLVAVCLASLGIYNLVLKSTWTLMDDGVFWNESPAGLVAARVAAGGPADRAGVREGDVLLAVDEQDVQRPEQ